MILERNVNTTGTHSVGVWTEDGGPGCFTDEGILAAVRNFRKPAYLVQAQGAPGAASSPQGLPLMGVLPAIYPEWLGGRSFVDTHSVRFPYIAGAMARGIASTELVIAMGRAGMLAFFGSAGLSHQRIEASLDELTAALGQEYTWGCNLINSITNPEWEEGLVDILLRRGISRVSASAYMELTPALVRYAFKGVQQLADGSIYRPNYVFAKISRPDVARHFMAPPPAKLLNRLQAEGKLTAEEVRLASGLPVAEDYIVESDSGGHTDNQPLPALLPSILSLREQLTAQHGYQRPIRVGAAGGLGTPQAVAAAFGMGAEFVVTGSINQCTPEAGLSTDAKQMLLGSTYTDFAMCPCADMFEIGAKVQVLKKGTMFSVRASQLYALYTTYPSLEAIPENVAQRLEKQVFRQSLASIWEGTRQFFLERNPEEVTRADADPKYKMALVFRWYMGKSSQWPIQGSSERAIDYQIWSGPALGSFNAWATGSFFDQLENRNVVMIALNMLEGAATITRAHQLRNYGLPVPEAAFRFAPRPLS